MRSAGFPVAGLGVFGSDDENAGLAEVARRTAFAEAVIWQNRSAYRTAVEKVASAGKGSPAKHRRRQDVVAAYWQRYCSKNDTIGFFGPLAWGKIRNSGPAIAVRSGALVAGRELHFESWAIESLARRIDASLLAPLNYSPEIELRAQLEARGDEAGLSALGRLEAAREQISGASGIGTLLQALDAFDKLFEELTGVRPSPTDESAAGGRTPLYLDCMRDLDVDVGPAIVDELSLSLPALFEASRWWCGRSFVHFRAIVDGAIGQGPGDRPFEPLFEHLCAALWQVPRLLAPEVRELQERWSAIGQPDGDASLAARAAAAFADHGPAWSMSIFQSADIQISAADVEAINRGHFLTVVGDFHAGNPLLQGMFAARHPDPDSLRAAFHADVGSPIITPILLRNPSVPISSRMAWEVLNADDIQLLAPHVAPIHVGHRSFRVADLLVRGDRLMDRDQTFSAPVADLLILPIYIAAMLTFKPFPDAGQRITVGRTVLRRATWSVRAADQPPEISGIDRWAVERGLPRRVFCVCDGEPKPVYVDFASPSLTRNLHRMLSRAASMNSEAVVRFSEMLPGPEGCWLEHNGDHFTSEIRFVGVDRSRRGLGTIKRSE